MIKQHSKLPFSSIRKTEIKNHFGSSFYKRFNFFIIGTTCFKTTVATRKDWGTLTFMKVPVLKVHTYIIAVLTLYSKINNTKGGQIF